MAVFILRHAKNLLFVKLYLAIQINTRGDCRRHLPADQLHICSIYTALLLKEEWNYAQKGKQTVVQMPNDGSTK